MAKVYHVIANARGGWSVKLGGAVRALRRFGTEPEAESYVRHLGDGVIYFHRPDGTVREKVRA